MKTNYVMIDMENVSPENIEALNQEWFRVYLFIGKNQTKLPLSIVKAVKKMGDRAEYIEMSGTGHNALDFHIAYYVGRISALDKDSFFHIVSKDQGFLPLIAHLKEQGVFADLVPSIDEIPALEKMHLAKQSLPRKIAHAKECLAKPNAARPRTRKTLANLVLTFFGKLISEEEAATIVDRLVASGIVKEDGTRIVYPQ